jgi:hypothetical protein
MMDIDNERSLLYVADAGNNLISSFDLDGIYKKSIRLERFQLIVTIRCLGNGELVTQIRTILPPQGGEEAKLLTVFNEDGKIVRQFGELLKHENDRISALMNGVYFETSIDKNIFLTFINENRIQKYSRDGTLLMQCSRPLNFIIDHKVVKRTINMNGREVQMDVSEMTRVSGNIGVDGDNRIWISTYQAQAVLDEAGNEIEARKIAIEIFDSEGIFLGRIPYPDEGLTFLKIQDKTVFFAADEYTSVLEYRIVEK